MTPASLTTRALFAFLLSIATTTAGAQVFRAYLASDGNDANPCTLAAPCRLLPRALTAVTNGGEIWMLDSANFNTGTVAVTKSVTIMAVPGAVGSIVAAGGPAVMIATAGVEVAIRNVVITPLPAGGGTHGIHVTNGASLTIDGTRLSNLQSYCIWIDAPVAVSITNTAIDGCGVDGISARGGARLTVDRVVITAAGQHGMSIAEFGANLLRAAISNTVITGSSSQNIVVAGNHASAVVKVSVSNSVLSFALNSGLAGFANTAGALVSISAHNNTVANNPTGLSVNAVGAKLFASGNSITQSNIGILFSNGSVAESAGNNALRSNVTDVSGGIMTAVTMR